MADAYKSRRAAGGGRVPALGTDAEDGIVLPPLLTFGDATGIKQNFS
jgi:hypothetical protein